MNHTHAFKRIHTAQGTENNDPRLRTDRCRCGEYRTRSRKVKGKKA